jgi:hypothetical protein
MTATGPLLICPESDLKFGSHCGEPRAPMITHRMAFIFYRTFWTPTSEADGTTHRVKALASSRLDGSDRWKAT